MPGPLIYLPVRHPLTQDGQFITREWALQLADLMNEANAPVNLGGGPTQVVGLLPLTNIQNASAASLLLGRGSAAGAGPWQEITIGPGLKMTGTTLETFGPGSSGYWSEVTTGNSTSPPELVFDSDGDTIDLFVPL